MRHVSCVDVPIDPSKCGDMAGEPFPPDGRQSRTHATASLN
jgi:hypothetical protein